MEPSEPYARGDRIINYGHRLVTAAGEPVQLTATKYDLLAELSVYAARVVPYADMLRRV